MHVNAILKQPVVLELAGYCQQARSILSRGDLTGPQAQELAQTVQELRLLLEELVCMPGLVPDGDRLLLVQGLHVQYVELEGLAKEKRDDLRRQAGAGASNR